VAVCLLVDLAFAGKQLTVSYTAIMVNH